MRWACFVVLYTAVIFFIPQCKPWKDWKVLTEGVWYQILYDTGSNQWIFLKKKENLELPGEFEREIGPFDGAPPVDVENFLWLEDQLLEIFGTEDSLAYKWTLVTYHPRIVDGNDQCEVKIFNFAGVLTGSYTLNGICGRVVLNERDHSKLIFYEREYGTGWILIDYLTGKKLGESNGSLPPGVDPQGIREMEILNEKILIVEQQPNLTRISLYSLAGVFLTEFIIPGEFTDAVHNGFNKKLFVTQSNNGSFGDLVTLNNPSIQNIGGSLNARNPIPGVSDDLQYHKIDQKDRWVHAAYSAGTNNTTIRIIDENGTVLKVHVYTGKIRSKEVMGQPKDRKVWALDRANNTDMAIVNLLTGDLVRFQTIPGVFSTMIETTDHTKVSVTTDLSGTVNNQEVGLY